MNDVKGFCKLMDISVPDYEHFDYYIHQLSKTERKKIEEILSCSFNQVRILAGGAGFKTGGNVTVIGTGAGSLSMAIDAVDVSGVNTANTFVVNTDRIADFANVAISASDCIAKAAVIECHLAASAATTPVDTPRILVNPDILGKSPDI